MEVGDRIRFARLSAGLSQAALAEKLNVQQTSITRYESKGEGTRPPGDSITSRVAVATGMPVEWLSDGKPFAGGPYAGRVELPGVKYSHKTIRAIEDQLAVLLPQFLEENKPLDITVVYPAGQAIPRAYVIGNEAYCLTLFAVETSNLISKHLEINSYVQIKPEFWVWAYMQPKHQHLSRILDAAYREKPDYRDLWSHQKLGDVSEKEWVGSGEKGFLVSYTPPAGFNRDALLSESIVRTIELSGCLNVKCVPNDVAPKEPEYPSFAPEGFKMIWLDDSVEELERIRQRGGFR